MTHPQTTGTATGGPLSPGGAASPMAWLVERAAAVGEAAPLLATAGEPGALVAALLEAGHSAAALRVVAAVLPAREGVWWAWVSARHAVARAAQAAQAAATAPGANGEPQAPPPAPTPPAVTEALAAVERWITQPDDANRRAAWVAAQAATLETPAGCAGAAAYFSGGSIAPPDLAVVPPPAGLAGTLVGAAVTLAALAIDAKQLAVVATAFVAQGTEIVKRLGGWEQAIALARQAYDAQVARHAQAAAPPPTSPQR